MPTTNRLQLPGLSEMTGRIVLAALLIGATVALAMGLRESGTALAFLLTAASVTTSVALSGSLDRVRPVSRPTTGLAIILDGLRQHWLLRMLTTDKTAQWACAAALGLVVALADSGLQAWLWPGVQVTPWMQVASLGLILLPAYLFVSLALPRPRAGWVVDVERGARELLHIAPRTEEPGVIARAIGRSLARTAATVTARVISILAVSWLTSSWLLMLAAALIALFLIAGGEVIGQLRSLAGNAHVPGEADTALAQEEN